METISAAFNANLGESMVWLTLAGIPLPLVPLIRAIFHDNPFDEPFRAAMRMQGAFAVLGVVLTLVTFGLYIGYGQPVPVWLWTGPSLVVWLLVSLLLSWLIERKLEKQRREDNKKGGGWIPEI